MCDDPMLQTKTKRTGVAHAVTRLSAPRASIDSRDDLAPDSVDVARNVATELLLGAMSNLASYLLRA
jgi:hypothetical protein